MASREDTGIEKGFELYCQYEFPKFLLLWSLSKRGHGILLEYRIGMTQHKAIYCSSRRIEDTFFFFGASPPKREHLQSGDVSTTCESA